MSEDKKEPVDLTRLDGAAVEDRKKNLERVRRYRELKDLKEILSTPEGRRVWRRLLEEGGAFRSPHIAGDPYATHVLIGEGNIARWALAEMDEARPATYLEMSREWKSDVLFSDELDKKAEQEMKE